MSSYFVYFYTNNYFTKQYDRCLQLKILKLYISSSVLYVSPPKNVNNILVIRFDRH